jgi:hypothetical protein
VDGCVCSSIFSVNLKCEAVVLFSDAEVEEIYTVVIFVLNCEIYIFIHTIQVFHNVIYVTIATIN